MIKTNLANSVPGQTLKNRNLIIFILGLLCTIGPFSIDMYLPGFPQIAVSLGVNVEDLSYTLSSYFAGICIGQLISGPLLDKYGRKLPLYVGLVVYILASVACAYVNDLQSLVIFRFFQALGGCLGIVAPRAIIRDLFPIKEMPKIFSILILILGVSPILAPTVGGLVTTHFGWHMVFIILAIFAILVLILVITKLPESSPPNPGYSLHPKNILSKYAEVIKVRELYIYATVGACTSASLFAYISGSPFVFMTLYKQSEQQYGYIFAIIATGLIICSQFNNMLLNKFSSKQLLKATLTLQFLLGLILLMGSYFNLLDLYSTIALMCLFLSLQGITFPNATALCLAPFTHNAGAASALAGSMQMAAAAAASTLVGLFHPKNAVPMFGVMLLFAGIALAFFLFDHFNKQDISKTELIS